MVKRVSVLLQAFLYFVYIYKVHLPRFFDVGPNPFRGDALRIRHGLSHLLKATMELIFMANIEG